METKIFLIVVAVTVLGLVVINFSLKKKQRVEPARNCYRLIDEDVEF